MEEIILMQTADKYFKMEKILQYPPVTRRDYNLTQKGK